MPKAFMDCVRKGGRMFTIKVGKDKYRHGCEINGETYYGEVKTSIKKNDNKNNKD